MHAPSEEKSCVSKDSFYGELKQVFNHCAQYHTKILLGDFNEKVGRENIFKLKIEDESLYQDSKDNCVKIANLPITNLVAESTNVPAAEHS